MKKEGYPAGLCFEIPLGINIDVYKNDPSKLPEDSESKPRTIGGCSRGVHSVGAVVPYDIGDDRGCGPSVLLLA